MVLYNNLLSVAISFIYGNIFLWIGLLLFKFHQHIKSIVKIIWSFMNDI